MNGIPITNVNDLIPENSQFWIYKASVQIARLHQLMNSYDAICWMMENVLDTDSWKEVCAKQAAKIKELE